MRTILLLTDFSENAWNALFTALKLFEKTPTRFLIMNCYEPTFAPVLGHKSKERLAVIYDSLSLNSKKQLTETMNYLHKHHQNEFHEFSEISIEGEIVDSVKEIQQEYSPELIVMGTKGATKARDVYLGSNTVKVIKKTHNCPVLAVPADHDFKSLKRIIFPTDFSRKYHEAEIRPLRSLAKLWNSRLIVFQVTDGVRLAAGQIENKALLESHLIGLSLEFQSVAWNSNIRRAILNEVESAKGDMVVLINYSHTFLERITREPVVKKMAFQTNVPLLIIPEAD